MAIYRPSELIQFLTELGIRPKKGLSQNFLIDGNIARKIVDLAELKNGETVVEIGPGPGSLTEIMLERGGSVIAVEKDRVLAQALERLKGEGKSLEVHCEDILQFPLENHLSAFPTPAKVIANLPYHITTPILAKLVTKNSLFSRIVVMVQEEMAQRMTATAGTAEYSSLSLFLSFYAECTYAFRVTPNCFWPVPKVDSAVVMLKPVQPQLEEEYIPAFFALTRRAFEQRRKVLRSSVKELYPSEKVMQGLRQMGKSELARPEELSLNDFIYLFRFLNA